MDADGCYKVHYDAKDHSFWDQSLRSTKINYVVNGTFYNSTNLNIFKAYYMFSSNGAGKSSRGSRPGFGQALKYLVQSVHAASSLAAIFPASTRVIYS